MPTMPHLLKIIILNCTAGKCLVSVTHCCIGGTLYSSDDFRAMDANNKIYRPLILHDFCLALDLKAKVINARDCIHLHRQLFLFVDLIENPILHTMALVDYYSFYYYSFS